MGKKFLTKSETMVSLQGCLVMVVVDGGSDDDDSDDAARACNMQPGEY